MEVGSSRRLVGGQEKQTEIQKEASSSEGEALLFHDGMSLV